MLSIHGLCKSFDTGGTQQQVLRDLEFALNHGDSVALLGDSGSGKSTLLHLIAGLDLPDSGRIDFDGELVHSLSEPARAELRRRRIGLVFQQFHLISTLKVADNIRFQAALCGRMDKDYEKELVDRLDLVQQLNKFPYQLSRGQQQRVAIARALLHKPDLVLADEPTGSLDDSSSHQVMGVFSDLVADAGTSLLMVTHSRVMADYMDRQVRLQDGKIAGAS